MITQMSVNRFAVMVLELLLLQELSVHFAMTETFGAMMDAVIIVM